MFDKSQAQEVGAEAVAIQAGGSVTFTVGISVSEARAIALDVAKATFFELSGAARETMNARVEEITDKVIEKLQADAPENLKQATDPDFQYALLTVQKQYGRTGDKDLGDLLVDLLVDRSKQKQRSIIQIVLNESLDTAPKLTEAQLANLAVIFMLRYAKSPNSNSHEKLGAYLDSYVQPFAEKLTKNNASFQHLEFAGCGSIQMLQVTIEETFKANYPGLFLRGFDPVELIDRSLSLDINNGVFTPCLNDPQKLQVSALDKEALDKMLADKQVTPEDITKVEDLFTAGLMGDAEIRRKCEELRPYMKPIFECWSNSPMKKFTLGGVFANKTHFRQGQSLSGS